MLYRNIKNGAEIETQSMISAPDWIAVGAEITPLETPHKKTPEVEAQTMPPQEANKTEPKSAPKKTTKRTRK